MRKLRNSELDRKSITEFKEAGKIPVTVILDNVRSQNNIGSVFRTCDAFLAERIILCGISATPPHREIHKTALGATESVEWEYSAETLDAVIRLRSEGYIVVAVEQTDGSLALDKFRPDPGSRYALVFGHEVKGCSQEVIDRCDMAVEIPQEGTKHSLNVAVSAGIVLWEFYRKIRF